MDPVPELLSALAAGRMVLVHDDASREDEGDLILAAQSATPEAMNFMLREARGMMCVALDASICEALALPPASAVNTSGRSTAYTVSVDAGSRFGVTTGVSASDRATTCRLLADATARPEDFVRPGHLHPLRARAGGCLVRAGHTECSVDLCRLAGLRPAAVIIEVMNPDGTMARGADLAAMARRHGIPMCSVADVVAHRLERDRLVQRCEQSKLATPFGTFDLVAYRSTVDPLPHVALTLGGVGVPGPDGRVPVQTEPVLVRVHRQNLLADTFGGGLAAPDPTLRNAMEQIAKAGRGALVYLRHDGIGDGLLGRLQTLDLQPDEAARRVETLRPGAVGDERGGDPKSARMAYGIGAQILRDLGLRKLRLLAHQPVPPGAMAGLGLEVCGYEAV